jgi:DNA invertase Pin-like site-specific DNA recombinase
VDLLGRYSNPDNVARLNRVLSGQGRDRPSHRPVPSLKQKQTRLTDSDRNEVIERYRDGESGAALAHEFGIHRATLFNIVRRAGIAPRYNIVTEDDIALMRSMYDGGQSLAAIGKHFGVSDGTVINAFRKLEILTRPRGTNQWSHDPLP